MGVEIGRPYSWYQHDDSKLVPDENDTERYINEMPELLELKFSIFPEPNKEVDFIGFCQCDYCKAHPKEAVRLCKGKTVFFIEGKSIYCDCLEEYLKARMMVLS